MIKTPIFIVGSPRSGTTLIRLILNNNSQIAIPDETGIFDMLLDKKFLFFKIKKNSILENALSKKVSNKFNRLPFWKRKKVKDILNNLFKIYTKENNKKYWGEKTPQHHKYVKQIKKLYPESTIIFMVRDPRAVIASSKRYAKKNDSFWASEDIQIAINLWANSIKSLKDNEDKVFIVKYEELVQNPKEIVKKICGEIGINFKNKMLDFYKRSSNNLVVKIDNDIAKWHKETTKPINTNNIHKWKSELSREEINEIEERLGIFMKKFNYKKNNEL